MIHPHDPHIEIGGGKSLNNTIVDHGVQGEWPVGEGGLATGATHMGHKAIHAFESILPASLGGRGRSKHFFPSPMTKAYTGLSMHLHYQRTLILQVPHRNSRRRWGKKSRGQLKRLDYKSAYQAPLNEESEIGGKEKKIRASVSEFILYSLDGRLNVLALHLWLYYNSDPLISCLASDQLRPPTYLPVTNIRLPPP
ncbi:hypothetical protein BJ684DRAFT_15890 [Piptocephalis cylindrospora]|uniref:Uncharacterized protein n=1 Tax=Piptocephalis cylindrospora TaxID=1907219 RepID=A0A4V1IY91_9FUNG|nr:hypothetical protein BJ684DRAFT_15890 [Piptocephalis cylindrospora]|eukprot:RKP13739.1 hypothetical protein BJ684DRAFT_15890 [Piptocephalis cylindrospora]